jgi:hypothetical protein
MAVRTVRQLRLADGGTAYRAAKAL